MTVPTVNPVSRRHLRQRKTPGRFAKRNGFPPPDNGGKQTRRSSKPSPGRRRRPRRRKKSLELWERLWELKIATLVNVHQHGRTLPLVAVGDNRIGKVRRSTKTSDSKLPQKRDDERGHGSVLIPTAKFTDTQLIILSAASQRDDRAVELPENVQGKRRKARR